MLTLPKNRPSIQRCGMPWEGTHHLWTLWDMLKAIAHDFVEIVLGLSSYQAVLAEAEVADYPQRLERLRSDIEKIKDYAPLLGLKSALSRIRDIEVQFAALDEVMLDDVVANVKELQRDIIEALDGQQFLYVPQTKAPLWENEEYFGAEVIKKIPEAAYHVYEGASCFAVGRAGGCVYHCMGIMQAGLFKLGAHLGKTILLDIDGWQSVVKKIKEAVEVLRTQAEAKKGDAHAWTTWKTLEASYLELISDVNAAEQAFRNPSAHYREQYTLARAEKILNRVGDFVRHVVTLLPEP
jgi:hypothetical protein